MNYDIAPGFVAPPHNAHYEGNYPESAMQWRRLGAADKVRNIRAMVAPIGIQDVLEVGCGTGAVLAGLRSSGIGLTHVGIDMADPNSHADPEADGLDLRVFSGAGIPFTDGSFDLVFASHVLEHVMDERGFLTELSRVSRRWIYIEVPCELNLRASVRGLQRSLNIGHINAYTPESFALTLATSGLRIEQLQIFDHSLPVHAFHSTKLRAMVKGAIRKGFMNVLPKLAVRMFTYHCGALCTKL